MEAKSAGLFQQNDNNPYKVFAGVRDICKK